MIGEIPDISPCLIEGPNGIGKTVAIQLLQLASGTMPSALALRPELWRSLRDRLGTAAVTGSNMRGANRVEIAFTPGLWPDDPSDPEDWIGDCRIDGQPASFAQLSALIDVHHISGTEDLAQTLTRHVETFEGHLRDVSTLLRKRHREVRAYASDLVDYLGRFEPGQEARDQDVVSRCEETVAGAKDRARTADSALRTLMHGLELMNKLGSLDADTEALLAQRRDVADRLADAESRLDDARSTAEALSTAVAAQGDAGRRLATGQRLLRTRSARAAKTRAEMEAEAFVLDLNPAEADVSEARGECHEQIRIAQARLKSLDTTGEVRDLIERILTVLVAASEDAREQELALGFTPPLTVLAAGEGLEATRRRLRDQPTPAEVRELNGQVNNLLARLRMVGHLLQMLDQVRREDELVSEAESDLLRLEREADEAGASSAASTAAQQAVGALENELATLRAELAVLDRTAAARGMVSREDAEHDVAGLERQIGLPRSEWLRAESELRSSLAGADAEVASAVLSLDHARRRKAAHDAERAELVGALESDERFASLLSVAAGKSDDAASGLARLKGAVLDAVNLPDELSELMLTLQGVSQSALQRGLNDSPLLDASRHLIRPLRRVLGARLTSTLNTPAIRARVFDGASITDIDPADGTVSLGFADGSTDVRALASYSTGEQAFAFTQARIADIEPNEKPNRVLFLDEFGAFVSADRMPDLAAFLSSDTVKQIANQVVVVLPLQVDYEAELENTRGSLRSKYEDRSAQIKQRGYSAVELS